MPSSKRAPTLASAAFAVLGAIATLSACDSNVENKIAIAQLAQNCLVNSDCESPLVCAFKACHAECESSRDCSDGARCVAAARPYKVCQLEEERTCERGSDCAEGLVCGVDGECRDQCQSDNDCVENQACVSGTCADQDELDEAGQLTPAPGKVVGAEGSPCVYVSDCSGALLCRGQACLPQCRADRDCATTEVCQDTRCIPNGSQPLTCSYNSDCETARGERCLGGGCRCMCAEDRDCSGGQTCDGCGCVAPAGACNYDSDCEESGEICRDGACACQCQTSADCGAEQQCDGCGCVAGDVPVQGAVRGSISIGSSLQLSRYRGVVEIYGDLMFAQGTITDLGDTFDQLRYVQGRVYFGSNAELTKISFPKLESVRQLSVNYTPKVTEVSAPLLQSGDIELITLLALERLDFQSFRKGSFFGYGLGKLEELELPATELNFFRINEAMKLKKIELPALTTVAADFGVSSGSPGALETLNAPLLAQLGDGQAGCYITFGNTQLTTLSTLGKPDWTVNASALSLTDNPRLGTCATQAFIARVVPADATWAPVQNNNLSDCSDVCNGETCSVN